MNMEGQVKSAKRTAQASPLALPTLEIPEGVRHLAASNVAHMRESCERMIGNSEAFTEAFERTCALASKSGVDWATKVLDAFRANVSEAFDFAADLMAAKTVSEMVDVTATHTRKQLDAATDQGREIWAAGQRMFADAAKPISSEWTKSFEVGAAS